MDNTFNLLKAWIEMQGYEIERIDYTGHEVFYDYKLKKKPKATREKKTEYTPMFEAIWVLMPKRDGSSKKEAAKELERALKEGVEYTAIHSGVMRYSKYVEATKTEFVYKLSNFIKNEYYYSHWAIPKEVTRLKLPRDEDLVSFAQKHGLPQPPSGMGFHEYRKLLEREIEKR